MHNCCALGPNSRREISGWKFYCNKLQMLEDVDCSGNRGSMFTIAGTSQHGVKKNPLLSKHSCQHFLLYQPMSDIHKHIGMYNTPLNSSRKRNKENLQVSVGLENKSS